MLSRSSGKRWNTRCFLPWQVTTLVVADDKKADRHWCCDGYSRMQYLASTVLEEGPDWVTRPDLTVTDVKTWMWTRVFCGLPPWLRDHRQLPHKRRSTRPPAIFPLEVQVLATRRYKDAHQASSQLCEMRGQYRRLSWGRWFPSYCPRSSRYARDR